ncbi:hypothetical protein [Treponema peruense]|uniref:Uncharacterized protein n=1 Tax=Treponema peruense TaxID=2787628 RepID=A0A7T3REN6_9SPIR|nr:hypothetical protein [Treponema peruense]QQA01670.1 hypothetical protein IWA51_03400 [Treponema peruense]
MKAIAREFYDIAFLISSGWQFEEPWDELKEYSSMFMTVSCLIKYPSEKFTYSDKERWQLAGLYKKEIAVLFYHLADQFKKC